jgi:hypothetical protein
MAVVVAVAIVWAMSALRSDQTKPFSSGKSFYTVDDGQTLFTDDSRKLPPFDYNGKPAYRCYVFTSDDGKTKFVGYLERYSEEAKKIKESLNGGATVDPLQTRKLMAGTEVKRPGNGETAWVNRADPRSREITTPRHPDDPQRQVVAVEP